MNTNINNSQAVNMKIVCSNGSELTISNDDDLVTLIYPQIINCNSEFCDLLIDDQYFVSSDARKIFHNILVNSCEFIPRLLINKNNSQVTNSWRIMTSKMDITEFHNLINIFQLMIERANNISDLITHGIKQEDTNHSFLMRYKMLIEGIKTSYEKGLILVKLLFREQGGNGLLSKYYRLIQGKENLDKRKELFHDLLFMGNEQVVSQNAKYTRKKQL